MGERPEVQKSLKVPNGGAAQGLSVAQRENCLIVPLITVWQLVLSEAETEPVAVAAALKDFCAPMAQTNCHARARRDCQRWHAKRKGRALGCFTLATMPGAAAGLFSGF